MKNYGGLICLFVILIQLIFFMSYCSNGINALKRQVKDLIASAQREYSHLQFEKELNKVNSESQNLDKNSDRENNNNNQFNNNEQINSISISGNNHNSRNISQNKNKNNNNILSSSRISSNNVAKYNFDSESNNEILIHKYKKNQNKNPDLLNNKNIVPNPPPRKNRKKKSLNKNTTIQFFNNDDEENNNHPKDNNNRKTINLAVNSNIVVIQNIDENDIEEDKRTYLSNEDKRS